MSNRPVTEYAPRQEMIPLHFIVSRVNVIGPVVCYALMDVGDVKIPVGVNHNAFARVREVGTLARKPPTLQCFTLIPIPIQRVEMGNHNILLCVAINRRQLSMVFIIL